MRAQAGSTKASLALLLLSSFASPAAADYKDTYKQGVEASEKSKWADAARLMQEAIAARSVEGETIRFYGQRFEPYLPHFYLGLALFNSGDCVGALRSWATSESQGAVRKSEQYKALTKNRSACEAKVGSAKPTPTPATAATPPPGPDPAALAQATQAAEAAVKRADDAARAVGALQVDPVLAPAWSQDAALGPAQDRAKDALAGARAKLEAARRKPDLAQLGEARADADRAAQQLDALTSHATRRRSELAAATRPTTPGPASPAPTKGPPAELLAGARAFFGAQYPQTVALLAGADSMPGRAGAQGLMLRAAARHAQYLIGGEKDAGLLASAQADARAARRLDPQAAPDPQAFSPRFVDLFKQSR